MSEKLTFKTKTVGQLIKEGKETQHLSLRQNIELLLDVVYEITHEYANDEVIEALIKTRNRGRKLNDDILKRIIKFEKAKE